MFVCERACLRVCMYQRMTGDVIAHEREYVCPRSGIGGRTLP
jgi:hypothetical protein